MTDLDKITLLMASGEIEILVTNTLSIDRLKLLKNELNEVQEIIDRLIIEAGEHSNP